MISFMKNCMCFFLLSDVWKHGHKNVNWDHLWWDFRWCLHFLCTSWFFCFLWCGQIMSSELIDLCFSISECCLLLVLFCFFSSDTNMARSPEHILSCQGAQCKSILYAVVPTKSSYSHWSCSASQSTPEPITVPKANVDWPVLGYMPKYPGLRVGEGSFLTETLCTLSRMWVNYRELLSEYVPSKGGGGKSWTTVSSTMVRKINNC